jgi:hypothetical protein
MNCPKFVEMQKIFQGKNSSKLRRESGSLGQDTHCRCQCCYQKRNHRRPSVPREKTKEK